MYETLNSKIDAKNAFVQSNVSNLIKQEFKTLEMSSEKALQTTYFILRNL